MEVAYLSALLAVAGSIVGDLTSGIATQLSQRAQVRAGRREHELSRPGQLHISSSRRPSLWRRPGKDPGIPVIVGVSIMRVVSSSRTSPVPTKIMHATTQTHFEPNITEPSITARELHHRVKAGNGINPLKEFSEVPRAELRSLAPR
jgi:hypothetical protein